MILVQFFTTPGSLSSFFPHLSFSTLVLFSLSSSHLFLSFDTTCLQFHLSGLPLCHLYPSPLTPSTLLMYLLSLSLHRLSTILTGAFSHLFLFLPSVSSHPCLPSQHFFRTIFFSLTFKTFSLTFFFGSFLPCSSSFALFSLHSPYQHFLDYFQTFSPSLSLTFLSHHYYLLNCKKKQT